MIVSASAPKAPHNWTNCLPFQPLLRTHFPMISQLDHSWLLQLAHVFLSALLKTSFLPKIIAITSYRNPTHPPKTDSNSTSKSLPWLPLAISTSSRLTFTHGAIFPVTSHLSLSCMVIGTCDSSLYFNAMSLRASAICIVIVFPQILGTQIWCKCWYVFPMKIK